MKEEKQGINWLDLILIGLSLFVANIIEKAINLQNSILSFLLFVAVAIILIIVTYFLKYVITRE